MLTKYCVDSNDSERITLHKVKVLAYIDETIKFIAENKGRPILPIAKTVRGYKFHEIRVKDGSKLIRIFYFAYINQKLVLLNGLEKPDKYDKGLKKKIDKKIQDCLEATNEYYKDFLNNQTYEDYQ